MTSSITGFYRFAQAVLTPIMTPWVKIRATGTENIPEKGPYLLVFNHLSDVDPLCVCWYFMKRGVPVRFLAKKSMFGIPVFGKIINGMGLIPVDREKNPSQALLPATRALNSGEVVCIWPEGTHTQEPDMWPMSFKTGAARLALDTGVPVIPVAQWGPQDIMDRFASVPDMRPGQKVSYTFMPPVKMDDLISEAGSKDHEAVEELTTRIRDAVTAGVEELRGAKAPERIWKAYTKAGPWWEDEQKQRAKKAKKAAKRKRN